MNIKKKKKRKKKQDKKKIKSYQSSRPWDVSMSSFDTGSMSGD